MEIHVKNQTAGVITYVDGNQLVYGGLHGSVVTDEDAWRAVGELREALTSVTLDGPRAAEARAQVAELDAAVRAPRPDKGRAAGILRRLTELLASAGWLADASPAGPVMSVATDPWEVSWDAPATARRHSARPDPAPRRPGRGPGMTPRRSRRCSRSSARCRRWSRSRRSARSAKPPPAGR